MREIFNDQLGHGASRVDSNKLESIKNVGLDNKRDFVPLYCKSNVEIERGISFPITYLTKRQNTEKVI